MIRIFGLRAILDTAGAFCRWEVSCEVFGVTIPSARSTLETFDTHAIRLWINAIYPLTCLPHFSFQLLDLDQVARIEWQRRVITVRFMSTKTAGGGLFATLFHCWRQPQFLKIPIKLPEVDWKFQKLWLSP